MKQCLNPGRPVSFVNPNKSFQTFLGIGGRSADASAEVFAKLPEEKQANFLQRTMIKKGIGYRSAVRRFIVVILAVQAILTSKKEIPA